MNGRNSLMVLVMALSAAACNAPSASGPSEVAPSPPKQEAPQAPSATKITASKDCSKPDGYCSIRIRGPIEAGAARKLVEVLETVRVARNDGTDLANFIAYIQSPGGSVDEGMALGRVLREKNAVVYADGPCYSSCVFVLAGGVRRYLDEDGEVGLHRSFLEGGDVSIAAYRAAHAEMDAKVRAYFQEMGISTIVLDLMAQVPSEGIRILTRKELEAVRLYGVDPVWKDFENGRDAKFLGLTTSQFLERLARMNAECGGENIFDDVGNYGNLEGCKAAIMYAPPANPDLRAGK